MKLKFFIFLFLNVSASFAQNYEAIDAVADNYKDITDISQLAMYINGNFTKQEDKARAIFRWVATNISYDQTEAAAMGNGPVNAFLYKTEKEKQIKEKQFKKDLLQRTMTTRKAVCHGYCVLIENLCQKTGLEAKTIIGNLKTDPSEIGVLPHYENHGWNAIKINSKWQFIDATLAAGFISAKTNDFKFYFNDGYFFTDPEKFALNHFPSDSQWAPANISKNDFSKFPVYFGYYFQYNYDINQKSGLLKPSGNTFDFKLSGLNEEDSIQYSFSLENQLNDIDQDNVNAVFSIPASQTSGYLNIFVNRKPVAIYKITS